MFGNDSGVFTKKWKWMRVGKICGKARQSLLHAVRTSCLCSMEPMCKNIWLVAKTSVFLLCKNNKAEKEDCSFCCMTCIYDKVPGYPSASKK